MWCLAQGPQGCFTENHPDLLMFKAVLLHLLSLTWRSFPSRGDFKPCTYKVQDGTQWCWTLAADSSVLRPINETPADSKSPTVPGSGRRSFPMMFSSAVRPHAPRWVQPRRDLKWKRIQETENFWIKDTALYLSSTHLCRERSVVKPGIFYRRQTFYIL